jgi:ABC-type uncharacterized transport system permease subunit
LVIELHQLTAALYLAASLATCLGLALPSASAARAARWVLALGALVHGVAFARLHTLEPPPPLTHPPAAVSLMAWLAVVSAILLFRRGRLSVMAGLVAPFAFAAELWASSSLRATAGGAPVAVGGWPHLHVILASAGLSLLGVAGLAGALFLAEDRRLKAKRGVLLGGGLPSLEALDRVNVLSLALGFPLLTFGVVAGAIWTESITGRFWAGGAHATWSALAWAVYLGLATARFAAGWRGREAAWSAALGFVFLLFAVLGVEALA